MPSEKNNRFYDEQVNALTGNLAATNANMNNLTDRLREMVDSIKETNHKLNNLCKDCEPARFVKAAKRLQFLVYVALATNAVILFFFGFMK